MREQQYEETTEKAAMGAMLPSSDTEGKIPGSEPEKLKIYRGFVHIVTVGVVTTVTPIWVAKRQHSASAIVYSGGERNSDAEIVTSCCPSSSARR